MDDQDAVASQDLILSTDGGNTFDLKIAAYLPPQQSRLLWSAAPAHVTQRARLRILLRLITDGEISIDSDDFSVLPAPPNPSSDGIGVSSAPGGFGPSFAGTGSCVTGTLPTLNYNLNHILPCPADFGGEPALAQDPNNPTRFQTVTGNTIHLRSRNVAWGYSGTATSRFLNFAGKISRQDMTTEVGVDGKVYATALAESSLGASDLVMIFRSTDGGATFSTGVAIPKPAQILTVDKPVITVHPTNAQILAVTFQDFSGGGLVATWVGICKQAATGNLASASNWIFFQPKDGGGAPL